MAQTLKFGNKVWAAKEESVLAYNDINNNYKPLPFSFARASIGTRVNKDGLIETMGQDIARIDYTDSADGVLLLEPSSTNYDSESENFDTSFMSNSNAIQSSILVSDVAPDGTTNSVFKISKVTDNSDPYIGRSGVAFTSTNLVFSVWLWTDSDQPKDVLLLMYRDAVAEITTKNITLTTTPTRYFIQKTFSNTPSNISYRIDLTPNSSNQHIYAWGKQVENNSYLTSYIPTSGSTVTRAAETCNNSGNSEVFNDSEGVLFAEFALQDGDNEIRQLSVSNGSDNESVKILQLNESTIRLEVKMSAGADFVEDVLIDAEINNRFAIQYKNNDYKVFVNGIKQTVNQRSTTSIGLDRFNFDSGGGGYPFYGKTKELGYYDTALTDLELETLTSYRSWVSMVNELNLNIIYNG